MCAHKSDLKDQAVIPASEVIQFARDQKLWGATETSVFDESRLDSAVYGFVKGCYSFIHFLCVTSNLLAISPSRCIYW